jgi:hypothetical protein
MQKQGYIYHLINNINGMEYIGSRRCESLNIAKEDNYYGKGDNIIKAIREFGKNNFTKTIIAFVDNAYDYEYAILKLLDCKNNPKYYNKINQSIPPMHRGELNPAVIASKNGTHWKCGIATIHSNETKAKISASKLGVPSHKWSDKSKALLSKNQKKTFLGKSGALHPKTKSKVRCITLDLVFDSINLAAKHTNCSMGNISSCCNNRMKHTKKLQFEFIL